MREFFKKKMFIMIFYIISLISTEIAIKSYYGGFLDITGNNKLLFLVTWGLIALIFFILGSIKLKNLEDKKEKQK